MDDMITQQSYFDCEIPWRSEQFSPKKDFRFSFDDKKCIFEGENKIMFFYYMLK